MKNSVSVPRLLAEIVHNSLTIQPEKSEIMILTKRDFIGPLKPVKLGDTTIKITNKAKCFGMVVDNKLSWEKQLKKIKNDLSCKLKQLKRMRILSKDILNDL